MNCFQDKYSRDAANVTSEMVLGGRMSFQKEAVKRIALDVVNKLELKPTDSLLDIGCNCGLLTIPLSYLCDKVTGVDVAGVVERLAKKTEHFYNIELISGDFLDVDIDEKYDCILIYSVLVYLDSYELKLEFIKKALSNLKPGGRLLIGDIINTSTKERFGNSKTGKKIDEEYREKCKLLTPDDLVVQESNSKVVINNKLNDETLMKLLLDIRKMGYESFLLPQSSDLPFGYTRQDILVKKWD